MRRTRVLSAFSSIQAGQKLAQCLQRNGVNAAIVVGACLWGTASSYAGQTIFQQPTLFDGCCMTQSELQGINPGPLYRNTTIDRNSRSHTTRGPWNWRMNEPEPSCAYQVGAVSLITGNAIFSSVDLALPAPGHVFVIGRSYNQLQPSGDSDGPQGINWFQDSQPEIKELTCGCASLSSNPVIYLSSGATGFSEYMYDTANQHGGLYIGINGAAGAIHKSTSGSLTQYTLYDLEGRQTIYVSDGSDINGQRWKTTDAAGNASYVGHPTDLSKALMHGFYDDGRIKKAYDSADRRYTYSYITVGGVERVETIVVETKTGGQWYNDDEPPVDSSTGLSEVSKVEYEYYDSSVNSADDTHGLTGQLKLATVYMPTSDGTSVKSTYYRYYTSGSESGKVKLTLDPEGVRRHGSLASLDTASDTSLETYCSSFLTYYSSGANTGKVYTAFFNGQYNCGCSSGSGLYTFHRYEAAPNYSDTSSSYDAEPKTRTVYERPDGLWVTQYYDEAGDYLSTVSSTDDPEDIASDSTIKWWVDYVERREHSETAGAIIKRFTPERVSGYSHDGTGGLFQLASTGQGIEYTDGDYPYGHGEPTATKAYNGDGITLSFVSDTTRWWNHMYPLGGTTGPRFDYFMYRKVYTYPEYGSSGSSGNLTEYTHAFWPGISGNQFLVQSETATQSAVSSGASGHNGSGSTTSVTTYYRKDGTAAFHKNQEGVLAYTLYENGQLIRKIEDADPTGTGVDSQDITDFGLTTDSGISYQHVVTEYKYDNQGRLIEMTVPAGSGTTRTVVYHYKQLNDGRLAMISFPRRTGTSSYTYYGPASYTITNLAGRAEFSATLAVGPASSGITTDPSNWLSDTSSDPIDALDVSLRGSDRGLIYNPVVSICDNSGMRLLEHRAYHTVLDQTTDTWIDNNGGSVSAVADVTSYTYDGLGRIVTVTDPTGTIDKTVYDAIGRASERWTGTDNGSPGNMTKVEQRYYDGADATTPFVGGGNSHLTSVIMDEDGNWAGASDQRKTLYAYDYRGRMIVQRTVDPGSSSPYTDVAPATLNKYDNLNRMVASAQYSDGSALTVSSDLLVDDADDDQISRTQTYYDERGQVWRTQTTNVLQSWDWELQSLYWYDEVGRKIKEQGRQLHKYRYDRLGRQTHQFMLAMARNSSGDAETTYADAFTVADDIVMEERQTVYDEKTGNPLFQVGIQRHAFDTEIAHGDPDTYPGALDNDGDGSPLIVTAGNIRGRVQIQGMWYDELDRLETTVNFGTHDIIGNRIADASHDFDWATDYGTAPARSAITLRTDYSYADQGTIDFVTDPEGRQSKTEYDIAGRMIKTIQNYEDGTPSGADSDQTVTYGYTNGLRTSMTAVTPTENQVTKYIYGVVTSGTSSVPHSKVVSNRLLIAEVYPDSTNTGTTAVNIRSDSSDVVSYAYNALGERISRTDQDGNAITRVYDRAGRLTDQCVTNVASGYVSDIRRINMTYNNRGLVEYVRQYDDPDVGEGTAQDVFEYDYDGWAMVRSIDQDITTTSGTLPLLNVFYNNSAAIPMWYEGSLVTGYPQPLYNYAVTYENDDEYEEDVDYTFGDIGSIGAVLARPSAVRVHDDTRVYYEYMGASTLVGTVLPEPNVFSRKHDPSTPGSYPGLDRFNRVIQDRWTKDLTTDRDFYSTDMYYDQNSNVTHAVNNIYKTSADKHRFDTLYTLDGLNRLTRAQEGEINLGTGLVDSGDLARDQRWWDASNNNALTHTGNWSFMRLDLNGDGDFGDSGESSQSRTHNKGNEITHNPTLALGYDGVGNMINNASSHKYVYDVFGRLREVRGRTTDALVAEYRYNGLGYRVGWHYDATGNGVVDSSDPWYYFAYDKDWRIVSTFRGSDVEPKEQFFYHHAGIGGSASGVDSVILRDRDDGSWTGSTGPLDERRYYCQNWRSDVVAVLSSVGGQIEQVYYMAYGTPQCIPAGDVDASGTTYNPTDPGIIQGWIDTSTYDVRGDIDLNGVVDINDKNTVVSLAANPQKAIGGLDRLSTGATANRKGYAGYERDGSILWLWHVRNRVYHHAFGRWLQRDPAGYVDGVSLYEYVRSQPIIRNDLTGLRSCSTFEYMPDALNPDLQQPLPQDDTRCVEQCNKPIPSRPGQTAAAFTFCDGPKAVFCVCPIDPKYQDPSAQILIAECLATHERWHVRQADCSSCKEGEVCNYHPGAYVGSKRLACDELQAHSEELRCLYMKIGQCGFRWDLPNNLQNDIPCLLDMANRISEVTSMMRLFQTRCNLPE